MEIKRDVYLEKLIRKQKNGLIKVITGIRRCGKSYLLFHLFHNYLIKSGVEEYRIIEVALDDRRNKELRDPDKMLEYIDSRIIDNETYYIILDEIQLLPEFEDVLNSLLHIRNVDVYVTGSNSKFLSTDVITEFRGRGDEIRVYPLSFSEMLSVYNGSTENAWDEYINYGGLPLVLSQSTPTEKAQYLTNLFGKVYLSDIIDRHKIRNEEEMSELTDILSSAVGSLTNPVKLSRTFQSVKNKTISSNTLKKYTDYLQDAFLISKALRYDIKGKRYIGSPAKYYFEDIGLRNARLGFRQTEETHLMENIIYNELRYRGFQVDVGILELFGKNGNGKTTKKQVEVDFIANLGSRRYYIQSAFALTNEEKIEQETRSLKGINDSFKKIIIVKDQIKPRYDNNGFVTMGIFEFLTNPKSLEL